MNVSIIMPVYNGGEILDLTIPPLLKQNYNKGNVEIIIINDASTDNSLQIIKKYYSNNNISIISNKNNKGRSYTRNKGIQNSSGQILIFVDCDIEVDQNFVSNHVKKHLDDNIIGLLSNIQYQNLNCKDKYHQYLIYGNRGVKKKDDNKPIHFKNFIIGCTSIKASAVKKIGGFNENINIYGEDLDFSYRLNQLFPNQLYYTTKIKVYINNLKTIDEAIFLLKQYGQHDAPKLLKKFPDLSTYIAIDFVHNKKFGVSFKTIIGTILFNSFSFNFFKLVLKIIPFPLSNFIIRYILASSIILGYRESLK